MEINVDHRALKAMPVNPHAQTILVIDDDMGVQMFVTQVLRNEGYRVLAAADMQEAQHVSDVFETNIHLILTDIILPTSNGLALAQALVAKRELPCSTCLALDRMTSTRFNPRERQLENSSRNRSLRICW